MSGSEENYAEDLIALVKEILKRKKSSLASLEKDLTTEEAKIVMAMRKERNEVIRMNRATKLGVDLLEGKKKKKMAKLTKKHVNVITDILRKENKRGVNRVCEIDENLSEGKPYKIMSRLNEKEVIEKEIEALELYLEAEEDQEPKEGCSG